MLEVFSFEVQIIRSAVFSRVLGRNADIFVLNKWRLVLVISSSGIDVLDPVDPVPLVRQIYNYCQNNNDSSNNSDDTSC